MINGYVDNHLQAKVPISIKVLVDVIVSQSKDTLIGAALLVDKKLEIDYSNQSVRIRNSRKKVTRKR